MSKENTKIAISTIVSDKPFEELIGGLGYASYKMVQDCGNTEKVGAKNIICNLYMFQVWAESEGHPLAPELVSKIETAYFSS